MAEINQQALADVVAIMKLLSHPVRLSALCVMLEEEVSVNTLADMLNVGQSALSQHLKVLRDHDLVCVRRDHRTLYYKTTDEKLLTLIKTLKELYCPDEVTL